MSPSFAPATPSRRGGDSADARHSKDVSLPSGVYRFGGTDFPVQAQYRQRFCRLFCKGSVMRADFNQVLATWLPLVGHAWYFQDDWR
jgi:hypothetical protein